MTSHISNENVWLSLLQVKFIGCTRWENGLDLGYRSCVSNKCEKLIDSLDTQAMFKSLKFISNAWKGLTLCPFQLSYDAKAQNRVFTFV